MVKKNKYGNTKGKIREEGKEFFRHKWVSFRRVVLLGKKKSPFHRQKSWWFHYGKMKLDDWEVKCI